jgi:hypothetical protein
MTQQKQCPQKLKAAAAFHICRMAGKNIDLTASSISDIYNRDQYPHKSRGH